jgi:aminocarboxymuconate-semialdehyde decarboxylase
MGREMIDTFCHWMPSGYYDAVKRVSGSGVHMLDRAFAMPVMSDPGERFRLMDRFPGYRQILSLVSPPVESLADPEKSPGLARTANDAMSELVLRYPDRFPGFVACLPANNPSALVKEAERAVLELGACGVQIFTNVSGRPVDGEEFQPLYAVMAELDRPVWLHPVRGVKHADYPSERYSKYEIWWSLGWLYETGAVMIRLAFAGVFEKWPSLKIITHHAGGVIPMADGRLERGMEKPGSRTPSKYDDFWKSPLKEKLADALRRFYADTATFGSKSALICGLRFFGPERMLFASDMPFGPAQGALHIGDTIRIISELELGERDKDRIFSKTIRELTSLRED